MSLKDFKESVRKNFPKVYEDIKKKPAEKIKISWIKCPNCGNRIDGEKGKPKRTFTEFNCRHCFFYVDVYQGRLPTPIKHFMIDNESKAFEVKEWG